MARDPQKSRSINLDTGQLTLATSVRLQTSVAWMAKLLALVRDTRVTLGAKIDHRRGFVAQIVFFSHPLLQKM